MRIKEHTLLYYISHPFTARAGHTGRPAAWLSAVAALLLTASCTYDDTYNHYEPTAKAGWRSSDTLTFAIPPQHAGTYTLNAGFRATQAFPYKRLAFIMERTVYPSRHTRKDTVRCIVADNTGRLVGKNGISNSEYLYRISHLQLREGDSLCIKIHHCMRPDELPGITDIGINLRRQRR